jgi:hypothetical protein
VPHVDRQLRQQLLNVPALAVPCRQSMHGRGVAKVVNTRLTTPSALTAQTGMFTDSPESLFEIEDIHSPRVSPHKE